MANDNARDPLLFVPTRDDVAAVKVGGLALNCWGRPAEVVEVTARREDANGRLFVCYYTKASESSSISMSLKEGELTRTVAACNRYSSAELDRFERQIVAARAAGRSEP